MRDSSCAYQHREHHRDASASSTGSGGRRRRMPEDSMVDSVRLVVLKRPPDPAAGGFGFSIKGGRDSGGVASVFVAKVEVGSPADRAGLRPGDQLMEVNAIPFSGIAHQEALKILKSAKQLNVTLRPGELSSGAIPVTSPLLQPIQPIQPIQQRYMWLDRQGRPVSPPPQYNASPSHRWGINRLLKEKNVRQVELAVESGQSLGLMIRGGAEYALGIFITGVDPDSVAEKAGLQMGDQIIEVNDQSFLEVTHDQAVQVLKFCKRMRLTVLDVGKIPHSLTAYEPMGRHSPSSPRHRQSPSKQPGSFVVSEKSQVQQMIEEKATTVLTKNEHATLNYYRAEYLRRQVPVEAFVSCLLELLNTPEKYTLMTEIREIVAPEDRIRFDELVFRRSGTDERRSKERGDRDRHWERDWSRDRDQQRYRERDRRKGPTSPLHNEGLVNGYHEGASMVRSPVRSRPRKPSPYAGAVAPSSSHLEPQGFGTPSDDSGVDLANGSSRGSRRRSKESRPSESKGSQSQWSPLTITSDLALSFDDDLDSAHQEYAAVRSGRIPTSVSASANVGGVPLDEGPPMHGRTSRGPIGSPLSSRTPPPPSMHREPAYQTYGTVDAGDSEALLLSFQAPSPRLGRGQHDSSLETDEAEETELTPLRHSSYDRHLRAQPSSKRVSDNASPVRTEPEGIMIRVKKNKAFLGIAIEGGANTKHPLPRIINIHSEGAAYDAGNLRVGQIIVEVDGQKMEGLQHAEIAQVIAESFAIKERRELELLVVEPKRSPMELRRSSLLLLQS